jgi:hypothetical protein
MYPGHASSAGGSWIVVTLFFLTLIAGGVLLAQAHEVFYPNGDGPFFIVRCALMGFEKHTANNLLYCSLCFPVAPLRIYSHGFVKWPCLGYCR